MSDRQTNTQRRLHWRFWLLLFAPSLVALGGTGIASASGQGIGGLFFVNIYLALPLNFLVSIDAAKQLVRLRDNRGGSSPWMLVWGPLIFFLNVALVFAGGAAMG